MIDAHRRRKNVVSWDALPVAFHTPVSYRDIDTRLVHQEHLLVIKTLLATLDPTQRELLALRFAAGLIERRFSRAMYALQEHNASQPVAHEALTNMQVDTSWQRDVRVYHSDLIPQEHARLAETYLENLTRLTARFAGLRTLAAFIEVLGFWLALLATGVLSSLFWTSRLRASTRWANDRSFSCFPPLRKRKLCCSPPIAMIPSGRPIRLPCDWMDGWPRWARMKS